MPVPNYNFDPIGQAGSSLPNMSQVATALAYPLLSNASNLVAAPGGGQTNATPVVDRITHVGTVAVAANSVRFPKAIPGMVFVLANRGANSMQVFGTAPDTINNSNTATGVAHSSGVARMYVCSHIDPGNVGRWYQL
jgi:hypothetical protein